MNEFMVEIRSKEVRNWTVIAEYSFVNYSSFGRKREKKSQWYDSYGDTQN